MTDLCFVTTCRSRLEHLKQGLATFAGQPGASCVVVDYDCPEHTAAWVGEHFPHVTVVRETERPHFEVARARNLGAAVADAKWLCFVDADNLVAPQFAEAVRPLLKRGHFYRPAPQRRDAMGVVICHSEDFHRIGGYDPVLQGYGMDDRDLYVRLHMAGIALGTFPGELVRAIPHSEDVRTENYEIKDLRLSSALNQLYCNAKWDMTRLKGKEPAEESRRALYEGLGTAVRQSLADGKPLEVTVPVKRQGTLMHRPFETALVYRFAPPPAADGESQTPRS